MKARERDALLLARALLGRHPEEAARVLEELPAADGAAFLAEVRPGDGAAALERTTPDAGASLLQALAPSALRQLAAALDPARIAALLARLDVSARDALLAELPDGLAAELRELMEWPPGTAGALMDPRVPCFRADTAAGTVLGRLRRERGGRPADVAVVDAEGHLLGAVGLAELALADPTAPLSDLTRSVPSVPATASREEVVEVLQSRALHVLPVVDVHGRLLGAMRQDELMTAVQQDAADDLAKMVGAGRDERALSTPWVAVRKRLPWLQINLLTAFLAAAVVGLFEGTIARFTALAVLLPVVAGQSGNTGAQALAVTMRGLALREVRARHWARVAGKELLAGTGNGVAVALTTSAAVWVWSDSAGLALVIGISMVLSMALAGLSGASIPMLLTALRQDPAQSASILLTTVTDVVGFLSFLGIATLLSALL